MELYTKVACQWHVKSHVLYFELKACFSYSEAYMVRNHVEAYMVFM